MTVLTENVVLARTRAQDLKSVKKLNCWGSELTDVSIIRRMPNVEVLSLSVNSISTLADFAHCPNLRELYIRKNSISNLDEVCFLQDLSNLQSLWLADNPCTECEKYRLSVLRTLPSLQKLDNIVVQPEEVDYAKVHGLPLIHPLECSSDSTTIERTISSEFTPEHKNIIELEVQCDREYQEINVELVKSRDASPSRSSVKKDGDFKNIEIAANQNMKNSSSMSSIIIENYDHQKTNIVNEQPMNPHYNNPVHFQLPQHAFQARVKTLVDHSGKHMQRNNDIGCDSINEHQMSQLSNSNSQLSQSGSEPDGLASIGDGYRSYSDNIEYSKGYKSSNYQNTEIRKMSPYNGIQKIEKSSSGKLLPKGGKNRNSNILSAILCLIKELDYASLEVVETAIHCRMEEMDD